MAAPSWQDWQQFYGGSSHAAPPPPRPNAGLYTGEPFQPGAPWGSVDVIPDAGFMTHYTLRSADPPPGALLQYHPSYRPGNSYSPTPGVSQTAHGSAMSVRCWGCHNASK